MDYQKTNTRWIYGLTLMVFGRNLVTYFIIALVSTVLSVGQMFLPFFGLLTFMTTLYLGAVSFIIAHKTILQDEVVSVGDAFALTPQNKTYFWQFLMINLMPTILAVGGLMALALSDRPQAELEVYAIIYIVLVYSAHAILMAFFGTSLVATAVGGDGMMMISRGRVTFFYSLTRLVVLPGLVLTAGYGLSLYLSSHISQGDVISFENAMRWIMGETAGEVVFNSIILISILQLFAIMFNLITAVVITKAFLLAEVRLAVKGAPTEWGKRHFGIAEQGRSYVYR